MNKKNKILFIGSFVLPKSGHYGGVYFASITLRDGMVERGYEIVELDTTLKNINETRVIKRIPDILVRQFKFIFSILLNLNATHLFIFLSGGGSYIDKFLSVFLAKLLGKKIVIFPRSGHLINDFEKKKFNFFIKTVLNISNAVICQSAFWKEYFKNLGVDPKKLEIIENWVEQEKIDDSKNLKHPSYSKNEVFKIIFVSRIEKAKGVDDIIYLAKNIKNKLNISIDLYGAGSYEKEFKNIITRNHLEEFVKFKGWLDKNEMLETINAFHVAIFSSQIEGYPNSLLDYIFAKVPVIASGIPMVKAVGGSFINYYAQGNIEDLTQKVLFTSDNYKQAVNNIQKIYDNKCVENSLSFSLNKLITILK